MQGSPSGKLGDVFAVIGSTEKEVANMEEDREYNACKALGLQIDNEDDVHQSSTNYQINEQEINKKNGLQIMRDRKIKEIGKKLNFIKV